jgi:UDP-galactopyranose mutase
MLQNIEVRLETDFFANKEYFLNLGKKIVYTGPLDQYFNFSHGHLAYRSLRFETSLVEKENYQGNAAINYTDSETPYTRIIEHKHFEFGTQANTIITKEYPLEWQAGAEPYYPINDDLNMKVFKAYQQLTAQESQIIFGGRLAEYRYYDMHQVIASALVTVKKELV